MLTKREIEAKREEYDRIETEIRNRKMADAFGNGSLNPPAAPERTFKIPTVSGEGYKRICETLAKEGFIFVVAIKSVSIGQLATNRRTGLLFDYIDPSEEMRSNIPPQMEVAIDPNNFRIEGSDRFPTVAQFGEIEEQEAFLKKKLPKNVRNLISMFNPNASILAQLDFEHKKRTGRVLFTDWFGCTNDRSSDPGNATVVGRKDPTGGLRVGDWRRVGGIDLVSAVSVVVLPRKLTV